MNNSINYTRGTTYVISFTYTAPTYLGETLLFTVKDVPYDTDATDVSNSIMTPKTISMTGTSFPQTVEVPIAPTDVADTVNPGKYFYSAKVVDTNGGEYIIASGPFVLSATSTNRN